MKTRLPVTVNHCRSLPPGVDRYSVILVLGSMPGAESLRRREYYAFKYNIFWRMTGEILGFDPGSPYPERLSCLLRRRVALWDVLSGCDRRGSLDPAIRNPEPNDIAGLLRGHRAIRAVCCNGTAAGHFVHRFFPDLPVPVRILPSTSPAAARLGYAEKLAAWRAALTAALD